MSGKRIHWLMIGLVVLLAAGSIAAVVEGSSLLKKRSDKLVSLKLDNEVADDQQTSLKQTNKDIDKYADLEKIAKSVVPQDKDQAETVREIVKIASDNGITLGNITFPASTLGQAATPAPAANSSDSGDSSAPKKAAAPLITQVKPVDGISGVYVMEINVQQDTTKPVNYNRLISFLSDLEHNRRTAQVSSVTVQPNPQDRTKLTFNLVLQVYIKP